MTQDVSMMITMIKAEAKDMNSKPKLSLNDKKFCDILEQFNEKVEQDAIDLETVSILLTQLLNFLTSNMSAEGNFTLDVEQKNVDEVNSFNFLNSDHILQLWQDICTDFLKKGQIESKTVDKFSIMLKSQIPQLSSEDDGFITEQIPKFLQQVKDVQIDNTFSTLGKDVTNFNTPFDQFNESLKDNGQGDLGQLKNEGKMVAVKNSKSDDIDLHNKKVVISSQITDFKAVPKTTQNLIKADVSPTTVFISNNISQKHHQTDLLNKAETVVQNKFSDIAGQIVDKIHLAMKGEEKFVNIKLKPDYLGEVIIKVMSENNKLKAEFFIQNAHVREMINANAHNLKNQIENQGYKFSEIDVYNMAFDDAANGGLLNQDNGRENHFKSNSKTKYTLNKTDDYIEKISNDKYLTGQNDYVGINCVV